MLGDFGHGNGAPGARRVGRRGQRLYLPAGPALRALRLLPVGATRVATATSGGRRELGAPRSRLASLLQRPRAA
ncbi:hypothetical protein GLE_1119 [Lysobacter enzymogenes]|uniref:Uncharacterized protein n=1 Tax=Lysobacter enzymogenes TaxID=69 RepID=A0A0S2DDU0_LYSEN|nr:hypothetical protein GLE_1119 [Lysobacter enzymogenes]